MSRRPAEPESTQRRVTTRHEQERTGTDAYLLCCSRCSRPWAATSCERATSSTRASQSYKNAKYEEAIEHFKNAVALDPSLTNARLYLATAYMQQYIPGADSPDNNRYAEQAIDEFKKVLDDAILPKSRRS